MKPTLTTIRRNSGALLTIALALVMMAGVLRALHPASAADTVCGDGILEDPETCDDGNLRSGDGCSTACTIEACGNHVVDSGEQCDDGNTVAGDGCNVFCQIEFCGDSIVQASRGEQCDDGNGIAGDGCSSSCKLESGKTSPEHPAAPDSTGEKDSTPAAPQNPVPTPEVPPLVVSQAQQGLSFVQSPDGADYTQYLSREEGLQLETILKKLGSGRRLTRQERDWAVNLIAKLEEAKSAERTRYTDLLKQFIATPISTEVVEEKDLQKTRLVDVQVPVAIDELKHAVEIVRRGELKTQVSLDVAKLKRQGIDTTAVLPPEYEKNLDPSSRPIEVFAALKGLKESTESIATNDVPGSLELIRSQVNALRDALPVFQQEYGIPPEEIEPLLTSINAVSQTVTRQDTDRVVGAVNRLLAYMERQNIFSAAEVASLELSTQHAAAAASRLIQDSGRTDIVNTTDVVAFVDGLSATAPAEQKPAFERGTGIAQRVALLKFLEADQRLSDLRAILRKDGRKDMDQRFTELRIDISHVGTQNDPETVCDDSMQDALRCTSDYLTDLQSAVRNRSFFTRFIGNLQDYFGIGS